VANSLVIVESPAKAKTIKKFLGKGYEVESSMGHIRDLPATKFGIDIENDFTPSYQIIAKRRNLIKKLAEKAKKSDKVYLAPDPDREGEAIAWHLAEAHQRRKGQGSAGTPHSRQNRRIRTQSAALEKDSPRT